MKAFLMSIAFRNSRSVGAEANGNRMPGRYAIASYSLWRCLLIISAWDHSCERFHMSPSFSVLAVRMFRRLWSISIQSFAWSAWPGCAQSSSRPLSASAIFARLYGHLVGSKNKFTLCYVRRNRERLGLRCFGIIPISLRHFSSRDVLAVYCITSWAKFISCVHA